MATYISMVNKLLRKINEVEVEEAQFNDVIGVTATAKDAIIDALDKIYNKKHKWPFMARIEQVMTTQNGITYAFPDDMLSVDWNSFVVMPYNTIFKGYWLKPLNVGEYNRYFKPDDLTWITNHGGQGKGPPRFVVSQEFKIPGVNTRGQNFNISPPPDRMETFPGSPGDQDYFITYTYFRKPTRPVNALDELDIPEEWEYVLFSRALYHMYLFYDNNERATIADADFQEGYKDMINVLLTNDVHQVYTGQLVQDPIHMFGSKYIR